MILLTANPDLALLVLTLSILLLYLEANRPGAVIPGCLGVFLFVTSAYALGRNAFSPAALACIIIGLALIGLSIWKPLSHLPVFSSIVLLTFGFLRLSQAPPIHLVIASLCAAILAGSSVWLGRVALKARRNKREPSRHHKPSLNGTG